MTEGQEVKYAEIMIRTMEALAKRVESPTASDEAVFNMARAIDNINDTFTKTQLLEKTLEQHGIDAHGEDPIEEVRRLRDKTKKKDDWETGKGKTKSKPTEE